MPLSSIWSGLRALVRNVTSRNRLERELGEEVLSYVELATAEKMKAGLPEAEARRQALAELGGVEQVKESVRDVRFGHFLETRWQDLRFAFRTLRKAPIFSGTVIAVLALGIGSTALMFTIVNSTLLQGPPFPESARLFMLWGKIPEEPQISLSPKEFAAWQKQTQSLAALAAFTGNGYTLQGRGEPELLMGQLITPSLLGTLQVVPALGRTFLDSEAQPGRDHVLILSDRLWREKFGARLDVLGQAVSLDGESYTVVGVMPRGFDFPNPRVQLWAPIALSGPFFQEHQDAHFLRVLGRLKPGVSAAQLQAETEMIGRRILEPSDKSGRVFYSVSLQEQSSGDLRTPLLVLLAAVVLLLAMACANVANLTLARGQARASELAVRAALGASRRRLIGQLLTEAALLGAIGGAAGFALAVWSLELLRHFAAENIPPLLHARVDGLATLFVVVVSLVCGLVFGVGPAYRATNSSFGVSLGGGTRTTAGAGGVSSRNALVFAEVALATILLVGCALMLRSFVRLATTDPGFDPVNVVTASTIVPEQRYPKAEQMLPFYRSALAKFSALPGVTAASIVTHLPFAGNDWGNSIEVAGRVPNEQSDIAAIRGASPGYFAAMGLPLKQGRDFSERDNARASGVAIVSEQFARRYWPNENPIGEKVRYDRAWLTVIGVCGDVKHNRLDENPGSTIYVSYAQMPPAVLELVGRDLHFVVRSSSPAVAASGLRTELRALDPQMVVKVDALDALVSESLAQPRFRTWLIAIFSLFALTLAALGIYGVIAYLVTQRYQEIGIRLALGATRGNIFGLILGGTLKLAAAATLVGLLAAFFLARFLTVILFGITPHDMATFVLVPLGLIAVALLSGFGPALRATRIDPVRSLRYE